MIQTRYERGADGQWSSVDYKGNRTAARATDLGNSSLARKPEGAKTAAEQIAAYSDKLFDQMRRDKSPDPAADAAQRLQNENLPLKSATQAKNAAADLRPATPEAIFEPSGGFKTSQHPGAESEESTALMAKLLATDQWEQASSAERAQTVAAFERAGLNSNQREEFSSKLGEDAVKVAGLVASYEEF